MKRMLVIWTLCSALALGSFGVLLIEDRLLDVPVPYSLALAFASMLVLGCALLALVEQLRARRPVVIRVTQPAPAVPNRPFTGPAPDVRKRSRVAQGLVLIDCSSLAAVPENAA